MTENDDTWQTRLYDGAISQSLVLFGQIDILVNSAASVPNNNADVADMNLDNWHNTLTANLTGTMLCSREVIKTMIPRRSGSIVNISGETVTRASQVPYWHFLPESL